MTVTAFQHLIHETFDVTTKTTNVIDFDVSVERKCFCQLMCLIVHLISLIKYVLSRLFKNMSLYLKVAANDI